MNLGKILTAECINVVPPTDNRCEDAAFRIANPNLCPTGPRLIIKPSAVLVCELGSVQLSAVVIRDGAELDVTDQSVFTSSNANVVVVGAASGNATGMADGEANVTAAFEDLTATAHITVLLGDGNCCEEISTAFMVLVDQTKSMGQAFGGVYSTKLAYAKAAATRFISEINESKDLIGLMRFTDTNTILSAPVADKAAVGAMVSSISQTQQVTNYHQALTAAIASLNAVTVDQRVLLLITDGEDQDDSYLQDDNPIELLGEFKANGGLVISLGVRAHDAGYSLLSEFSTGGFFLNAWPATASIESNAELALGYLSGLKGYICSGNCAPAGDVYAASGQLNYSGFANWNVTDGHVDLVGNGFLDLLPGNDLYVDMAGSQATFKGKLVSKAAYPVVAGTGYVLSLDIAGNQRLDAAPNSVEARVFSINNDGLATPVVAPVSSISGSGLAFELFYEWAVSYVNDEGETPLSPISSASNNSFSDWTNHVTHAGDANATLCKLWRRQVGELQWELRAQSTAVAAPVFDDSGQLVIDDFTNDPVQPATINMTGSKNVRVSQTITINDFQQPFQTYSLTFTAPLSENVYLSIQQISSPAGYDAIGLLVGRVVFATTGLTTLLDDTFANENLTYIPPACGTGLTPIDVTIPPIDDPPVAFSTAVAYPGGQMAASGHSFIYSISWVTAEGETAVPLALGYVPAVAANIAIQLTLPPAPASVIAVHIWRNSDNLSSDQYLLATVVPSQLVYVDIETHAVFAARVNVGVTPPLVNTTGTSTAGTTTPAFSVSLIPVMTSATTPSGVASASSMLTEGQAWHAFDGSNTYWYPTAAAPQWLAYQFPAPVVVNRYSFQITAGGTTATWTFEGSQDGVAWDVLDTQTGVSANGFGFYDDVNLANTTAYLHYRVNFSAFAPLNPNMEELGLFHFTPEVITPGYSSYAYVTGYNCYGEGCLDEPPPEQRQDPNPLTDIETDSPPPPGVFTSSKTVCKTCPDGFSNYAPQVSAVTTTADAIINPFRKAFAWDFTTPVVPAAIGVNGNFSVPSTYFLFGSATSLIGVFPTDPVASGSIPVGVSASIVLTGLSAFAHFKLVVQRGTNPTLDLLMALPVMAVAAAQQVCATATGEGTSQGAADSAASDAATAAALAQLNCLPAFTRTVVATATCPTNTFGGPFSASATRTSLNSDGEALAAATLAAQAAADALRDASGCSGSNNTQQILIRDSIANGVVTPASPWPSVKFVSGIEGTVSNVVVTLHGLSHGSPEDVLIVLRSPSGEAVELMRRAGGLQGAGGVGGGLQSGGVCPGIEVVFDDAAAGLLPDAVAFATGTYRPSQYGVAYSLPLPAPQSPYSTTLAAFDGIEPNGAWSLWVADSLPIYGGLICLGWTLDISTAIET